MVDLDGGKFQLFGHGRAFFLLFSRILQSDLQMIEGCLQVMRDIATDLSQALHRSRQAFKSVVDIARQQIEIVAFAKKRYARCEVPVRDTPHRIADAIEAPLGAGSDKYAAAYREGKDYD